MPEGVISAMDEDQVERRDEELIEQAYTYLTKKTYPDDCTTTRKRVIQKKAVRFELKDGELYYKQKQKGKGEVLLRYIESKEEQKKILLACHVDPTSGHMGRTRTLCRIKERFMWHGMVNDVQNMLATCDVCQRMNRKLTTGVPQLHPIPVKSPWYMVGIDFIGPLSPQANDGSRFILTLSDYFTKWVDAVPTADKSASSVAASLFKIFMRMGLPQVVLSDNGREFNNELDTTLSSLLGIKRRLTTPYHPQANGLDERFNQTLQNMLVKFVSTKKEAWSSYLDTCVFAYNTSRHESTKFSPFELMFGRQATLPIDVELQKASLEEVCQKYHTLDEPDSPVILREHNQRLETAKQNILVAQQKQKASYDKKHAKPERFQVSQLVLKKDFTRKKTKGGKLRERYLGPYTITKVLPHGTYELAGSSNKSNTLRATGAHLKPYESSLSPPPEDDLSDESSLSPPHENDLSDESSLSPPPEDNLSDESSFPPPHEDDLSKNKSSFSPPPEDDYQQNESSFSPPPEDDHQQNEAFATQNEIPDEDDPVLPPPMPSLQELYRAKRGRESHSLPQHVCKKAKWSHKAVVRNVTVKDMMLKRRQRRWKVVEKPDVIDVESYKPRQKSQRDKIWIQEHNLHDSDREILLNPTGLLTDNIIDAAQMLLRQAFPALSGLQSVSRGLTMDFDIEPAEFIQILHNHRGHWLTISTIGTSHPDVHVYDSMYPSAGTHVKTQTAALLHTESSAITLKFMAVQMQAGGYDCGLFAVAFAVALAFGKPPGQYHFVQEKMRHHLWKCFENRKIDIFPYSKLRRATETTIKSVEEVPVYCVCRMPELPNTNWIECSSCKNWYHTETCILVPPTAFSSKTPWFCSKCN